MWNLRQLNTASSRVGQYRSSQSAALDLADALGELTDKSQGNCVGSGEIIHLARTITHYYLYVYCRVHPKNTSSKYTIINDRHWRTYTLSRLLRTASTYSVQNSKSDPCFWTGMIGAKLFELDVWNMDRKSSCEPLSLLNINGCPSLFISKCSMDWGRWACLEGSMVGDRSSLLVVQQ